MIFVACPTRSHHSPRRHHSSYRHTSSSSSSSSREDPRIAEEKRAQEERTRAANRLALYLHVQTNQGRSSPLETALGQTDQWHQYYARVQEEWYGAPQMSRYDPEHKA